MKFLLLTFSVGVIILQTECAKILGIIPVASYSHQAPFQPLWRELSLRGHQVTVMTTNPMNNPSLTNLTEIDLSFTYEIYKKYNYSEILADDSKSFLDKGKFLRMMLNESVNYQLSHPQVQDLIHDKDVKFDLVIVEAQLPGMMAFSWRFSCPMIGVTSVDSGMQYHLAMGNPVHPMVNPDLNLPVQDPETMTFQERIASLVYYFGYSYFLHHVVYPPFHQRLKRFFGGDLPDLNVLHSNMVMLFINTHPIFHSVRALNPNTITIGGGIHLKEPEALPKDIQEYLDNATEGAIYFSLGTNVNHRIMHMPEVLKALSELPYRFLLKTDLEPEKIPANVVSRKWLPQQDILRHRNLKLFITQGGLQSLQEAVYNAVPLVGIPFLGDQIANINRMVKQGYGIKMNKNNITTESLKEAVLEVMDNPKYRERVEELSDIFRDEEVSSLDKAIWWTEYVIKHKGADHLRNPVVEMPLWKYFMIDVVAFLFSFIFISYRVTKFVCSKLFFKNSKVKLQ